MLRKLWLGSTLAVVLAVPTPTDQAVQEFQPTPTDQAVQEEAVHSGHWDHETCSRLCESAIELQGADALEGGEDHFAGQQERIKQAMITACSDVNGCLSIDATCDESAVDPPIESNTTDLPTVSKYPEAVPQLVGELSKSDQLVTLTTTAHNPSVYCMPACKSSLSFDTSKFCNKGDDINKRILKRCRNECIKIHEDLPE